MGTVIGMGNKLGQPVKLKDAGNHIFGHCMFNDWSARDI
jgi:fumarylacetoacetase